MSLSSSPLTSSLSKARGLGSAKDGTGHFWWQRVAAIIMLPLLVWFVISFLGVLSQASYDQARDWFANPVHAAALLILVTAMFFHAKLGVQVVVEDYIHAKFTKIAALFLINALFLAGGIMSWMAIISLHLKG